jgi:hypothetical protein
VLAVLAACATQPIDQQAWDGATYDQVVAQWGPPQAGNTLADGTDVRIWIAERPAVASSSGSTVGFGVFGGSGHIGSGVGVHIPIGGSGDPADASGGRCERRLHFRGGYVVDEEWLGSDRACELFRRH